MNSDLYILIIFLMIFVMGAIACIRVTYRSYKKTFLSLYGEPHPPSNVTVISSNGLGRVRQQQSPNYTTDAAHSRSPPSSATNYPTAEWMESADDGVIDHGTSVQLQSFVHVPVVHNQTIIIIPSHFLSSSHAARMNAPPPSYEEATKNTDL